MQEHTQEALEFSKIIEYLSKLAISPSGSRRCLCLKPFDTEEELHLANNLFEDASYWFENTPFILHNFPDIGFFLEDLESSKYIVDVDDVFAIWQVLKEINKVTASFQSSIFDNSLLKEKVEALDNTHATGSVQNILSVLERTISADGLLKDTSSLLLNDIRHEMRLIHRQCTQSVKEFIQRENVSTYVQDEYFTLMSDRYVLPLKTNFKGQFQNIVHGYSQSGETCFVEPVFLVEVNNRLQALKHEERQEEERIFKELTVLFRIEKALLTHAYDILTELDVLLAKKTFAEKISGYILPVGMNCPINLQKARHPYLCLLGKPVVPLDILLEDTQKAIIISGGNAGGKTICLKTLGLTALLAFSGIPVPVARGSSLPFWKNIFIIMGDEQNIAESVSTFTAQIKYLVNTLPLIDSQTLFLLDEFGSGTDPNQGAALSQAIIDTLLEKNSIVVATTHFAALKSYALSNDKVSAASMVFDEITKQAKYKIIYDQIGISRAFEVAKEYGLSTEVLEKAEKYLHTGEKETEEIIKKLNAISLLKEEEYEKLTAERTLNEEKYRKKIDRFEKEKTALINEINKERREIVAQWEKSKISSKEAQKKLTKLQSDLLSQEVETNKSLVSLDALEEGMTVRYLLWKKEGQILRIDERKKQIKLSVNGISILVDLAQIALCEKKSAPKPKKIIENELDNTINKQIEAYGYSRRLDVRGMRSDEAIITVSRFLDEIYLEGASGADIIHGRGTGALRFEIQNSLKLNVLVQEFFHAREDFGGDGVTQVILKG